MTGGGTDHLRERVETWIGKPLLRRVPSAAVEDTVVRLFRGYLERRATDESFSAFCKRLDDAELIALGTDAGAGDVAA